MEVWAVRAELDKILASKGLVNSSSLSNFLHFIVEETLEGRGDRLKEYVLGVEVFHKGGSYDPRTDSIVRAQATNLRAKLREYYETQGRSDAVWIDVPKGGYTPVFQERGARLPEPQSSASDRRSRKTVAICVAALLLAGFAAYRLTRHAGPNSGPAEPISVAVLPFINLSSDPANEYFSDGLTEELIHDLAKVEGLRVPARTSAFAFKGSSRTSARLARSSTSTWCSKGACEKRETSFASPHN